MSKVKFGEDDSRIVEIKESLELETQQANDATRKHTRIQRRIEEFYAQVDYVAFPSADEAPIWATNWRDWLLTGLVPVPDEVSEETAAEIADVELKAVAAEMPAADLVFEDQPGNEPDAPAPDDQPDPPTAAVA